MRLLFCLGLFAAALLSSAHAHDGPVLVKAAPSLGQPGPGRLLLFAEKVVEGKGAPAAVDADPFVKNQNFVAAREVSGINAGEAVRFYPGDLAFPVPVDQLPPGDYWVQALLDRDHSYGYSGRGAGDVASPVRKLHLPAAEPLTLELAEVLPGRSYWTRPDGKPLVKAEDKAEVERRITEFSVDSDALTAFWGTRKALRGFVLTPPGYGENPARRYPVVYFTHGFQAGMASLADSALGVLNQTGNGRLPPMIWVFLDQSLASGTHEFADSVNNGPWGRALTAELLPEIDRRYRTDPSAGRYLMGHSSGGWAAVWLQVNYPTLFRGAFATSPDFLDFSVFEGLDLADPNTVKRDTSAARMEEVLAEYGGQAQAFEWVFSPRAADGRPRKLYDRATGKIDREVADYWLAHWDLSRIVRQRWAGQKRELDGKLHIYVGDKDEYGLDVSVRKFEQAVRDVAGQASFAYLPGKGHYDLYAEGSERMALRRRMGWEIWKTAYPDSPLKDAVPAP
ncbi:alpha/beta hydrolase [Massilia endophytica]|uniref:alpha/beta hydrolase n=1 Tax=Massilia endophytica TaxID=2899220 RepID=UPI001E656028|nr:alpha/beta hydrolase [Massilia endophytica]UGQ44783.1 esterase family protein [Massilia endophytica]